MPKDRSRAAFICGECGNESQKWAGFCHVCDARNTLVEIPKNLSNSPKLKNYGLPDSPELLGTGPHPIFHLTTLDLQETVMFTFKICDFT